MFGSFEHSSFGFISDFDIRISDLIDWRMIHGLGFDPTRSHEVFPQDLFLVDPAVARPLAWGLVSAFLCLWKGLNQTNMSNIFAFALWIVFDLAVIALGAGAFFTGFLTYIINRKELKDIINAAVVIGLICYSGAVAMLGIDIGQPIRGWFIFWHANVHSMLTEVSFCITAYLSVLPSSMCPCCWRTAS